MSTTEKVFSIVIKGSVEDVWREVTKTDETQGVMFNMKLDSSLAIGAPMRMRSPDGKYTGIIGEVTAFEPLKRYGHTFKFTQYDEEPCHVLHEIEETGEGVRYTMTCTNMVVGDKTTKQMTQGADMIIKNLKSIVETGSLPFTTKMLYGLFKLTAPFTPKSMLSENYP